MIRRVEDDRVDDIWREECKTRIAIHLDGLPQILPELFNAWNMSDNPHKTGAMGIIPETQDVDIIQERGYIMSGHSLLVTASKQARDIVEDNIDSSRPSETRWVAGAGRKFRTNGTCAKENRGLCAASPANGDDLYKCLCTAGGWFVARGPGGG